MSRRKSDLSENKPLLESFANIFKQHRAPEDVGVFATGTVFDLNTIGRVLTLSIALGKLKTSSPSFRSSGSKLSGTTTVSSPSDDAMR